MKKILADDFCQKHPNIALHLVFSMIGMNEEEMLDIANSSIVNPIACYMLHAISHPNAAIHLKELFVIYKPKTVGLILGAMNPDKETLMIQMARQGSEFTKIVFELAKNLSINDKYTLLNHQNKKREKFLDILQQYAPEWIKSFNLLQRELDLAIKIRELMRRITASTSLWYRLLIYRQHKEKELQSCLATFQQSLEFSELDYFVARQILTQFLLVCKQPRGNGQETTSYARAIKLLQEYPDFHDVRLLVEMESPSSAVRYSP